MADQSQQPNGTNDVDTLNDGQPLPVQEQLPHSEGPPATVQPPTATNPPTSASFQQGVNTAVSESSHPASTQPANMPASSSAAAPVPPTFDSQKFKQEMLEMMQNMVTSLVPTILQQQSTATTSPATSTPGPAVGHGEASTPQVPQPQVAQGGIAAGQGAQAPTYATGWMWTGTQ